jgi:hypothetical protein
VAAFAFSISGNYTILRCCLLEYDIIILINLTPVAASLCESGFSSRWLAQMNVAVSTHDDSLSVAKDSRNLKATWAFDIHKKRVGALYQSFQLVCAKFLLRTGV